MRKKIDQKIGPRVVHYFRNVDLASKSRPEFIPEAFPLNCEYADDQWSAGFLLRAAVRFQHIWATYGVREGHRTIISPQPAVCFSDFNLADLIAVRDGFSPRSESATQYALTFPLKVAQKGGIQPVVGRDAGHSGSPTGGSEPEWRWLHTGNYKRRIERIESSGWEGNTIPGLKLSQKKWAGIGVVVPDMASARALQYDILSLIDRQIISTTHFDHILVCDKLPDSLEGLSENEVNSAFASACYDFKSCLNVGILSQLILPFDFGSRVLLHDGPVRREPVVERGGCWLWFEGNTHEYVRALVMAGRVKVNKHGRYLASLDELENLKELRLRQDAALKLGLELYKDFGIRSSYFSVLNSQSFDDVPSFSGDLCETGYYVVDTNVSDKICAVGE
ncbi:hypothetical protein AWM79_05740 [Pseudomonas agarici]|uniref:DUF4427 domain-containing protein n=1 Tax=Pseudomonas agarici TaxID=46677 RepID=A0A0X1SYC2_PSEAA|nr:DUF4427 domain-containing protein [Pseudomonas agarici]AMB84835.1 hypothetical protein AWM79_05740 [Pseudomonas agarici]